jgi:hypothetical protein
MSEMGCFGGEASLVEMSRDVLALVSVGLISVFVREIGCALAFGSIPQLSRARLGRRRCNFMLF